MRRLTYGIFFIIAVLIVIGIALLSRNEFIDKPISTVSGDTLATTSNELTKVTVSEVTHSVFYAPQYVAMNLGFFKDEGLEIELINGGGADNVMTSILANQVDIGLAGPEATIYVYNENNSDYAEVFAQLTKRDGSMLVAREKTSDFTWEDLKGKHVIPGRVGGVPYMTFEYVLKENNIDPQTDLTLDTSISFDAMTSAFVSGIGDYVTVFEPTASSLETNNQGYIVAAVGAYTDEIPYTAYFAKKSYIENNSDIIERFTRAIYRGQQWINEHTPAEIAEVVRTSFPDSDIVLLEKSIANYKTIDAWNTDPFMTKESFDKLQEVMTLAGELEKYAPYEAIVNNTFAEKVR